MAQHASRQTPKRSLAGPPQMEVKVERLVRELFELIDTNGAGSITLAKLGAAFSATEVAVPKAEWRQWMRDMDVNNDNRVTWEEFHEYLAYEVVAVSDALVNVLVDDLVLPCGLRLPLAGMVQKLGRQRVLREVEEGGAARTAGVERAGQYVVMLSEQRQAPQRRNNSRIWRSQRILTACGKALGTSAETRHRHLLPSVTDAASTVGGLDTQRRHTPLLQLHDTLPYECYVHNLREEVKATADAQQGAAAGAGVGAGAGAEPPHDSSPAPTDAVGPSPVSSARPPPSLHSMCSPAEADVVTEAELLALDAKLNMLHTRVWQGPWRSTGPAPPPAAGPTPAPAPHATGKGSSARVFTLPAVPVQLSGDNTAGRSLSAPNSP
ncbi:hypothetical protein FOA52_011689 [Chlamydomonas sp. UWO 241]|nr:hypothetical protein FOA52_011689 [Chlamydomonas sp. UWO 241]